MNYYVVDTTNGDSLLFDTDKAKFQSFIRKFKPELQGQEIQETERKIILLNNKYVFADEHIEELKQKEVETLSVELKAKRDAELNATDFYLMPDYPISEEDLRLIQSYRQALRDLPQQEDFPYVEFPKNPLES